jgi:hypothetical protein
MKWQVRGVGLITLVLVGFWAVPILNVLAWWQGNGSINEFLASALPALDFLLVVGLLMVLVGPLRRLIWARFFFGLVISLIICGSQSFWFYAPAWVLITWGLIGLDQELLHGHHGEQMGGSVLKVLGGLVAGLVCYQLGWISILVGLVPAILLTARGAASYLGAVGGVFYGLWELQRRTDPLVPEDHSFGIKRIR